MSSSRKEDQRYWYGDCQLIYVGVWHIVSCKWELLVNLKLQLKKVFLSLLWNPFSTPPHPQIPRTRRRLQHWGHRPWRACLKRRERLFPVLPALGQGAGCPGLPARCGPACYDSCRWADLLALSMERQMLFRPAPGLSIFHYSLLCLRSSLDSPHGVGTSEWRPTATLGLPKVLSHRQARRPPLVSSRWQAEGSRAWLAHAESSHTKCHCMGLVCGGQMKGISKSTGELFLSTEGLKCLYFPSWKTNLKGSLCRRVFSFTLVFMHLGGRSLKDLESERMKSRNPGCWTDHLSPGGGLLDGPGAFLLPVFEHLLWPSNLGSFWSQPHALTP